MRREIFIFPFLLAGGCAVLSSAPSSSSSSTATASAQQYEVMDSQPPEARREDVPKLDGSMVWVPGYYQPVAGNWIWHDGQSMPAKDGYKLAPASYREENGKVYFTPPRWRRADLAEHRAAK